MAACTATSTEINGACHAIPIPGPPGHPCSDAWPGAHRRGCCLQQLRRFSDHGPAVADVDLRPGRFGESRRPRPATAAPATSAPANAAAEITANWEKFFDSSTSVAEKAKLLENGGTFSSAIQSLVNLPLASGLGAKVTAVVVNSATSATVSYNIVAGGSTLLANQTGKAVYQDGIWKVGDATLCNLFKLIPGGSVPSACSSVS